MPKVKDIKTMYKKDKPREKLMNKGVKALSNKELIAIILGSGTKKYPLFEIAKNVENFIENNQKNLTFKEFSQINGLGTAKSALFVAIFELGKRFLIKKEATKITSPQDTFKEFSEFAEKKQEYFVVLTLDGGNYVINKRVVFLGTLTETLVHPREVFYPAIEDRAASIILCHNHPSGNLTPSEQDKKTTKKLLKASEIMGIKILDHIIVSKNGFLSFKEENLLS